MNRFAKLSIAYTTQLLGIQQDRALMSMYYLRGTDQLVNIDDPDIDTADIDYRRTVKASDRKKARFLFYKKSTYEKTLKINVIKLFLLLNFEITDLTNGIAEKVSYGEMGEKMGCTVKTVRAALEALSESAYISYTKLNPRYFTAKLLNYKDMFKKAKDGGQGYLSISSDALNTILSLRHLNDIRIAMVSIFESVKNEMTSPSKTLGAVIPISSFKKALPDYLRPCHIRKSIVSLSGIGEYREDYQEYRVKLSSGFSCRPIQNALRQEAKVRIRDHFKDFSAAVDTVNREIDVSLSISGDSLHRLRELGAGFLEYNFRLDPESKDKWKLKPLTWNSDLIDSLAGIAVNFETDLVIDAINTYYMEYVNAGIQVANIPGLITSIIKDELHLRTA